jgi:hypothetical protein
MAGISELGADGVAAFYGVEADRAVAGLEEGQQPIIGQAQQSPRGYSSHAAGQSQAEGQQLQSLQQQLDVVQEENNRWRRVNNQLYQMVVNDALPLKAAETVSTPEQGRRKKPRAR